MGVDVRLSTYADAALVEAEAPEVVVIATGSLPRMDGVQFGLPGVPACGTRLPHVMSSHDLLLGPQQDEVRHALVLDDTGHLEAAAVAEYLVAKGAAVTFVTRHAMMTPYIETTLRTVPILERLYRGNFTLLVRHQLVAIVEGRAIVRPTQSESEREVLADLVVLVTPNAPLRDLYDEVRHTHPRVWIVGDAHAPRDLQTAIAEGHRTVRAGLAQLSTDARQTKCRRAAPTS